jgi:hypothetical protein
LVHQGVTGVTGVTVTDGRNFLGNAIHDLPSILQAPSTRFLDPGGTLRLDKKSNNFRVQLTHALLQLNYLGLDFRRL